MSKHTFFSATGLLGLALGAYFILSGISGINDYQSASSELQRSFSHLFGQTSSALGLAFGVFEIIAGIILVLVPTGLFKAGGMALIAIIGVIQLAGIVWFLFINHKPLEPTAVIWLRELALQAVILVGIWSVKAERG